MKRIFIILIITCLLIPFFTINLFAAEYDFETPKAWDYETLHNDTNPYASLISVYSSSAVPKRVNWRLLFYPNGYQEGTGYDRTFTLDLSNTVEPPSYYDAGYRYRATNIDLSKNCLALVVNSNVRTSLVIPGISYDNVYMPQDEQYFKVQFSVDTTKLGTSGDIPEHAKEFLNPEYLCFFELMKNKSDSLEYEPFDNVPYSSVVVEPSSNGRVLKYTYYFNSMGSAFDVLRDNPDHYNMRMVVRIPYYFGNSTLLGDGVFILTNYDLPSSYEIITPGGYSQEIEGIQNAIITSNENLIDYYDTLTGEDQAVIVHAKQQNEKLDYIIKDYDDAQSEIDKIVENVTLPSLNIVGTYGSFENLGLGDLSTNDSIWQGPVVAMAVITFSFAIISLVLYGKKE